MAATPLAAQVRPYPDTLGRRPAPTLPAVSVTDSATAARFDGFEARRRRGRGAGHFITRAEIEQRNPRQTSDLLRRVQGLRIVDSAGVPVAVSTRGPKPTLTSRQSHMSNCVLLVGLNGTVSTAISMNSVPPSDIYGIEVHTGSTMPAEFSGARRDSYCGLIMIWTR